MSSHSVTPGARPPLDATPQAIRAGLLPEEVGAFDREFRRVMADAMETLDLTEVLSVLQRWERVAWSSRDALAHRRMLAHADQLAAGADVRTEPWSQTRARLDR